MKHSTSATPKDVFLRLFNFLCLYLVTISFIALFIQYINVWFPDPLYFYFSTVSGAILMASAILTIATPAYLLSAWLLGKDIQRVPAKRDLRIVKWLTYLTLFVSAVTIIIDLITFVYNFLSGELTIQFFLKIFVVLLVAGAVFGYFLWDLKHRDLHSKTPKRLAWALAVLVVASVTGGVFLVGTPAEQRARRFDEQRVSDLQTLQYEIVNYWIQKDTLPEDLLQLEDSISGFMIPVDPETEAAYEYSILDPLSFQLCATFTSASETADSTKSVVYSPFGTGSENWSHGAETTCFDRVIDPELYVDQKDLMTIPVR